MLKRTTRFCTPGAPRGTEWRGHLITEPTTNEKQKTGDFAIVTVQGGTGPVFRLVGEIDGSSASQVLRNVKQCPAGNLVLDFSGVTEIGEFGARVLGAGLKEICGAGMTIDVDGLRPGLSEVLCLGGVFEAIVGRT